MKKFVAVKVDNVIEIHLPGATCDYDTMCGIDSRDDVLEHFPADLPKGAKCNCPHCLSIWTVARKYKNKDFMDGEVL
jgi:hypothetical protein